MTLLSAVLPLFGSWVGTILAFYFTKENFEAASRSVQEMAKTITPQERLQSTPAKDKMIRRKDMHVETLADDDNASSTLKMKDVLANLDAKKVGSRIPFLRSTDQPVFVLHRSAIDRFLAGAALQEGGTPIDPKTVSLKEFLGNADLKKKIDSSFVTIGENATLADAKKAMEDAQAKGAYCQDVFVTATGAPNERVLGWITNVTIEENSKV